ncbi:MAG: hypothetical protein FWD38_05965 [Oscillospiraceae bacterium]|nr:hypothetical protein [Oscillospiraceae bacterium]
MEHKEKQIVPEKELKDVVGGGAPYFWCIACNESYIYWYGTICPHCGWDSKNGPPTLPKQTRVNDPEDGTGLPEDGIGRSR